MFMSLLTDGHYTLAKTAQNFQNLKTSRGDVQGLVEEAEEFLEMTDLDLTVYKFSSSRLCLSIVSFKAGSINTFGFLKAHEIPTYFEQPCTSSSTKDNFGTLPKLINAGVESNDKRIFRRLICGHYLVNT